MRIAVMGSGAVGGYFGAKLAAAGHDMIFVARGGHLAAMRRDGLRIESPGGSLQIRNARFTDEPGEIGAADLILFCVKSYDTEIATRDLAPVVAPETAILSLQNGIDNPDRLARLFGRSRVLAGVVYVGAQVVAPGVIEHSNGGRIIVGSPFGAAGEAMATVRQAMSSAAVPCEASPDIVTVQWRKLLWNAPFCAIGCLLRAPVSEIVASAALTHLAIGCMREVQLAARSVGIELPDAALDETIGFSRTLGAFKPSMLQDLEAKKPLEHEAFNGIVVDLMAAAGREAPINRVFRATLAHLDKKISEEASR